MSCLKEVENQIASALVGGLLFCAAQSQNQPQSVSSPTEVEQQVTPPENVPVEAVMPVEEPATVVPDYLPLHYQIPVQIPIEWEEGREEVSAIATLSKSELSFGDGAGFSQTDVLLFALTAISDSILREHPEVRVRMSMNDWDRRAIVPVTTRNIPSIELIEPAKDEVLGVQHEKNLETEIASPGVEVCVFTWKFTRRGMNKKQEDLLLTCLETEKSIGLLDALETSGLQKRQLYRVFNCTATKLVDTVTDREFSSTYPDAANALRELIQSA